MTQAKHTPGSWMYESEEGFCSMIISEDGDIVCQFDQDPKEADARLIAAAPEQHELLCIAPVLSMYHGANGFELERFINDYEVWSATKRAAIAKATGASND